MQWCHWLYHWHHVALKPAWMTSHDHKVILHLICHSLRNVMMTRMMLLPDYDADGSANGIKLPKSHVAPHLKCLDQEMLGAIDDTISIRWCKGWYNGVTWPKSHVSHFDHLDLRNAMVPVMVLSTSHDADTNAIILHDTNSGVTGIMWCWCWCQWHHMTKKSCAHHFNCLNLSATILFSTTFFKAELGSIFSKT